MNKCENPVCSRRYTPGKYGRLQRVCGRERCRKWYRDFAARALPVSRGLPSVVWDQLEEHLMGTSAIFQTLIVLARETAMRKGEILGLEWRDVLDKDGKAKEVIALRGQWSDRDKFKEWKTGEGREVMMTEKARRKVEVFFRTSALSVKATDRIIEKSESWAWSAWVGFQRVHGVTNPLTKRPYRFHDIRHTAAVELVSAGRIDLAQKLLGHKSIVTTMRYATRPAEEVLADIEKTRRKKK